MTPVTDAKRSPLVAGLLSLLIPGLGQAYTRNVYRGAAVCLGTLVVLGMVAWYGVLGWYAAPIGMWLWNAWDAVGLAGGRPRSILAPVALGLVAAYGIGWNVAQIDFRSTDINRAIQIARPMLHPDFIELRREKNSGWVAVEIPCSANPPAARHQENGITAFATPDCGRVGETLLISISGLWPDADTQIWWQTPIGDPKMLGGHEDAMLVLKTDGAGALTTAIRVPTTALTAQPDPTLSLPHRIYFEQFRPTGGVQLSENGNYVLQGMGVTIALALMATTLSIFVAIPLSFLAARNLMGANPLTLAIYVVVRTLLNIVRSIESLIVAIVFVVVVGLGPFAGVMALAIHSVAALAKLYSEVIEGIDPGPIEAIRATGANWLQIVRYGVIPQIVPPFTAFTIYRWDINVRSATIIGFVGGGGIGQFLIQWIQINDLRAVSAAFIAIAVVVVALDYFSAQVRARLI